MRSGLLRHRLEIQKRTLLPDSFGADIPVWNTIARVWGEVKPIMGKERFTADQTQAEVSHEITLRDRRDVSAEHRILFGTRVFNIVETLRPSERHISLRIMALEEVA